MLMATYDMGFLIRQMRHQRGMTQEQLCMGLCPRSTLSRIERGQLTPSSYLFKALIERLGCYSEKHFSVFLSREDFAMWQKREALNTAIAVKNVSLAKSLIEEIWGAKGFEKGLGLQFLLICKASLAILKAESESVKEAELIESLRILNEAINITIPNFDESKIGDYLLSYEEIIAISSIAGVYFFQKEYERAVSILDSLKRNMDIYCLNRMDKARYYPYILSNLVEALYELKRYDDVISICVLGRSFCIEYCRAWEVPVFLTFQGKCLAELGRKDEAKQILLDAFYSSRALGQQLNTEILNGFFYKTYGEKLV